MRYSRVMHCLAPKASVWSSCFLFGVLLASCRKPTPGPVDSVADRSPEAAAAPNTLTAAETAEGWKLLFDGQSLTGWHVFGKPSAPTENWHVEDGAIAWKDKGGDLASDAEYQDFELSLEWKISEGGNSGVFFHVTEDNDVPWKTGPEMQVLDDERHPDGRKATTAAGANYALYPAEGKQLNPVGEWNQARLRVQGSQVEHWLNGKRVVSYSLWTEQWKADVAASKFASMPDYGSRKSGLIVLQDHGNRVWFRNIKLRAL